MKTKLFCTFIICLMVASVFSQSNLNSYKYVIVAEKFDFLKESNQYRINELAVFLFEKYGFEAVMEGEGYPNDLLVNRCLGLKANVLKDPGMFRTKLSIQLKDCNDRIVFTSDVGESRKKEYSDAYNEALRNAFASIEVLNYKYEPNEAILALETPKAKNEVATEIQQLRQEVQALKEKKEQEINEQVKNMPDTVLGNQKTEPKLNEEVRLLREEKEKEIKEIVKDKETNSNKKSIVKFPTEKLKSKHGILYAQTIENGFQLVDSTPSVVYKIKKTSIPDVYLVEGKNATVYKKDNNWILEYYENDDLKQEVLNIKF